MNKYVLRLPSGNKAGRAQKNVACVNRSGKTTQMYLDLGQKDFGSTQTCKLCNMLFVNDDELDFKSHEKYCKKRGSPFVFPTTVGHNVVREFEDEKCVIHVTRKETVHKHALEAVLGEMSCYFGSCDNLVTDTDPIYILLDKAGVVLGCVVCEQVVSTRCAIILSSQDASSQFVQRHAQQPSSSSDSSKPAENKTVMYGKKRPLVTKQQQEGEDDAEHNEKKTRTDPWLVDSVPKNSEWDEFLLVHIKSAQNRLLTCASNSFIDKEGCFGDNAQDTVKMYLGVKLIWVSPLHRRQGVARALLDTARRCFIFGTVVAIADIVFSQPTEDGFAFASAYCKSGGVNAYC